VSGGTRYLSLPLSAERGKLDRDIFVVIFFSDFCVGRAGNYP
jgi:hypothetical protein